MQMPGRFTCCKSNCLNNHPALSIKMTGIVADRLAGLPKLLLALLAGGIMPLSLAPFHFWPLALLSAGLLFCICEQGSTRQLVLRFYAFNVAMYGVGASWIFVSVNQYGNASPALAGLLVGLLVLAWSLLCLPQAYLYARWFRHTGLFSAPAFAAIWVFQEWFRGWFLTGFPWLYTGYSFLLTPLDGYAPYLGVLGISLAAVTSSCALAAVILAAIKRWRYGVRPDHLQLGKLIIIATLAVMPGFWLDQTEQTRLVERVSVSLVQGNIDQHAKWRRSMALPIQNTYKSLTQDELGRDLVIWPEAALTRFRQDASAFIDELHSLAQAQGTSLVLGIPDRNAAGAFQNTVMALGEGEGQYIKRRLVPFGEYVPLEPLLSDLIGMLELPLPRSQPGPAAQPPLVAGGLSLSTSICYEVVFPELVRTVTHDPDLLVTISNDTWFGASIGPWQHLQMAQMRALENGRSLIRATNNGITGIVDHQGRLVASLPQFEQGVLRGEAEVREGITLFHRVGSYPTLALCLLLLAGSGWRLYQSSRGHPEQDQG